MVHSGLARVAPSVCQSSGYNSSLDRLHGPHSGYHLLLLLSRWPASLQGASSPLHCIAMAVFFFFSVFYHCWTMFIVHQVSSLNVNMNWDVLDRIRRKNSIPWSGFQFYACFEFHALSGSAMMGCLVPRRECPCQAERRAREEAIKEQAAFLNKEQNNKEEEAEKQEESRRNRLFGFGLLRNLQSLFGSNLNLGSVNSSNGQPKGKRGSYRALAQDEETPTVAAASSDQEDSATSPGSMASASISSGSRMSTTGTESPVVVASRLPTIVSLRLDCWPRCWPLSLFRKLQPMLLSNVRNHKTSQLQDVFVFIIVF